MGEAAWAASSDGVMEGHDIPPNVLTGVVHWLHKGGHDPVDKLGWVRKVALEGSNYCHNDGCEVVGTDEGLQTLPAMQDHPVLQRCVPETGLDDRWAQDNMWHIPKLRVMKSFMQIPLLIIRA